MPVRVDARLRLVPEPTENLRPAPDPGQTGGIYATVGNHQIIDWWDWSHDPANGDLFGVKARATGGQMYWAHAGTAGGDGSQASPWNPSQLTTQINNRSMPAGSIVNMAPGNYDFGTNNQWSGGGGNGGWVTLLGPANFDTPAQIRGNFNRYWSFTNQASRVQMVRLQAHNTGLNPAFMSYVDNGGGRVFNDAGQFNADQKLSAILGANVASIGFQVDGKSGTRPGAFFWVNCYGTGLGEIFGTFQHGNAFGLGCWGHDAAYASPAGRSIMSLSWWGGGWDPNNSGMERHIVTDENGKGWFGGSFGCLFFRAFQLHPSTHINHNEKLTDGNGGIFPTDENVNNSVRQTGEYLQQACISFAHAGAGLTGYNAAPDGVKTSQCTAFGAGASSKFIDDDAAGMHRPGTTQPLPTRLAAQANQGSGGSILAQRYKTLRSTWTVSGSIGIASDWHGSAVTVWGGGMQAAGRGNVFSTAPNIQASAIGSIGHITASRGSIIESESVTGDSLGANAHLKAGSPAIGEAYLADAEFKIDFMGRRLVDRGGGRCDAGALQAA